MPTKKADATSTTKKTSSAAPAHGTYQEMIKDAILYIKERNGASRQAIKKYIKANNNLGTTTDAAFSNHINKALTAGEKNGIFSRPKGPSGPVKLAKKDLSKTSGKLTATPAKSAPKSTKSTSTATKKTTGTKKAAPVKKSTTPKAAPAKKPAKPKANAGKPRKTAASAPAVEKKDVVLGKTKSGRVTKSTAAPSKSTGKAAATKKAPAKKAATAKSGTPKKSEA